MDTFLLMAMCENVTSCFKSSRMFSLRFVDMALGERQGSVSLNILWQLLHLSLL